DIISYLSQYGHLLCTPCRSVIPFKSLQNHLQNHHHIRSSLCRAIARKYENLPVSQTDSDVTPLPNGTQPIRFLAKPVTGYYCKHCSFLTVSWSHYRKHLNKSHRERGSKIARHNVTCFLQEWMSYRRLGKYWRVDASSPYAGSVTNRELDAMLHDLGTTDPQTAALLEMEAEEEARLADEAQGSTSLTDELEHDENTDWLRGSGWPRWFAHKPLHLIVATSRLPSPRNEVLHLGSWNCIE
ncbi:hypothetical protein EJ07DRAFT_68878, partial [Lizonia empirigonia]